MRRLAGFLVVLSLLTLVRVGPAHAGNVVAEKDTTLDETIRVANRLRAAGIEVLLTRADDRNPSLSARAKSSRGSDLFVSIHNNASRSRGVNGTEAYYQIGNKAGGNLAWDVVNAISQRAGTVRRGAFTRKGDNGDYYAVLRESPATAIIVEGAFLSNPTEAQKLASADFRQRISDGIADALIARAVSLVPQGPAVGGPRSTPLGPVVPTPSDVRARYVGNQSIDVSWSPVGLATYYEVWRDGTLLGTTNASTVRDVGLAHGRHRYEVRAVIDVAGKIVQESKSATADAVVPWRMVLDAGHGGKDPGAIGRY